jgi:hypothetical protein
MVEEYEWRSRSFSIELQHKEHCLSDRHIVFIGESHARYNWDQFIFGLAEYQNILRTLGRHHGDASIAMSNSSYKEVYYARGFIQPIRSICEETLLQKTRVSLVFQPGSWDATMWPPQQFIENPESAQSLIHAIGEILAKGCSEFIRLVWVQQVPYPTLNCDGLCFSSRLSRNNYAISSMNYYFERELEKLKYPDLRIVRAYDIILPRAGEFVCNNHYLCHLDNQLGMLQTAPGDAVGREIFREIC